MSYFDFENKRVYYSETGTGRPLLLLHGNTASSNMFYNIVGKYTSDYNVICIDFLGHGNSDRLERFPADLWFYEAQQIIAFLKEKQYESVDLIGSSGGALAAINVALEAPELVGRIIADSFEGETVLKEFTENVVEDRENSKQDESARQFYAWMNGDDWESVVDNDTRAIAEHAATIKTFFHKPLSEFKPEILLTGSKEDEFVSFVYENYFEHIYGEMIKKMGHGSMHLFESGRHPALLSNMDEFVRISREFLKR